MDDDIERTVDEEGRDLRVFEDQDLSVSDEIGVEEQVTGRDIHAADTIGSRESAG